MFSFVGFISNLTMQRQFFPTEEDQTGAAKALLRLQDTYQLSANTISNGDLPGEQLHSRLWISSSSTLRYHGLREPYEKHHAVPVISCIYFFEDSLSFP